MRERKILFEQILSVLADMTSGVQILSFIATILILSSFLCRGERNIRLVNAIGSVFAIIYSPLPNPPQWSNLILNVILLGLNGYYLLKGRKQQVQSQE